MYLLPILFAKINKRISSKFHYIWRISDPFFFVEIFDGQSGIRCLFQANHNITAHRTNVVYVTLLYDARFSMIKIIAPLKRCRERIYFKYMLDASRLSHTSSPSFLASPYKQKWVFVWSDFCDKRYFVDFTHVTFSLYVYVHVHIWCSLSFEGWIFQRREFICLKYSTFNKSKNCVHHQVHKAIISYLHKKSYFKVERHEECHWGNSKEDEKWFGT